MELILRGTTDITSGEETGSGGVLLPSGAFMDDKTTLVHSKVGTPELLDRFHDLFTWARMKAKPKKRRSMPLIRGTVCDINFSISGYILLLMVREQPVKSLGRLYAFPLTDRHRGVEIQRAALETLHAIEKSELPGKLKVWSLTPLPVDPADLRDFPLPDWNYPIAHQQVPSQVVGCAPCFSTVGLYTTTGMLQLPFSSITEAFKVGKARLHMVLRDSPDGVICQVQPEVRTGTKWSVAKVVQEALRSQPLDQKGHGSHPDWKSWPRK